MFIARPCWLCQVVALNIHYVGVKMAQLLTGTFPDIDRLLEANEDEIVKVPGIGPKVAHSLSTWLQDEKNRALIERLRLAGVNMQEVQATVTGPLTGQTFLLTRR